MRKLCYSIELMATIVSHPELCVIQTEMFLYLLLRKWVYLRCNPDWQQSEDSAKDCERFFRGNKGISIMTNLH